MVSDFTHYVFYIVAEAYGTGDYGTQLYEGGPLDSLAETGWSILLPIFLGLAIVFASLIALWRSRSRKQSSDRDAPVRQ